MHYRAATSPAESSSQDNGGSDVACKAVPYVEARASHRGPAGRSSSDGPDALDPGIYRSGGHVHGSAICVWYGTFFSGEEVTIPQCGAESWASGELQSAKNNCGVNVRIGWQEGGTTNWKACVNPGGERPNPGRFNRMLPNGC
jgi:hypothetical protein